MKKKNKYILWFNEVGKKDLALVGGKGANLGEMASFGIPVPKGFIVTSQAYSDFLDENELLPKIKESLYDLDTTDPQTINEASQNVKRLILKGTISKEISQEIINAYLKQGRLLKHALVAIRSSATAEDLPDASFAGQQATFLNVQGEARVVELVKECWASLFEPRAIFYREEKGFDHFKVGMAVPVQEMVPSQVSGVMFTVDPVTNDKKTVIIEAIWGLGEYIVQGKITPDRYLVDKKSLEVIQTHVSPQSVQLVKVGDLNKQRPVAKKLQLKRKLTNKQIKELTRWGLKIHKHYFFPQDIEWALDKGKFWILQTRPVTTLKKFSPNKSKSEEIKRKVILKGVAAGPGLVSGLVQIVKSAKELKKVEKGEILVTSMTTPDFVLAMKKAVAIVTDKGGQTSHAAIVSRELGIPCVVGTEKATKVLKNGRAITVNGAKGEIYSGGLTKSSLKSTKADKQKESKLAGPDPLAGQSLSLKTATKIYVNLGEPQLAESVSSRNVDGVGLLRAEFMMAEIGVHPKKVIKDGKQKMFVNKLATNLEVFCEKFKPRPVVYRSSDFKTNEYRNLVGGKSFEPEEENPLLGYRGAFRYLTDPKVFELELRAIKKVRNKMGLKNLWLMIPFCRTPRELMEVKKLVVSEGLIRSPSFKLWLMVEIPSNVILLDDFIKVGIDGVSIGSNDLTMLVLGVDRDNAELAKDFNEQDPAVLWALKRTIETCQKAKVTSSICGQAPSVYPDLVENLVKWGISSLSVNPDAIERTRDLVYQAERRLVNRG